MVSAPVSPFQLAEIPFAKPIHKAPVPAAWPNCFGSTLAAGNSHPLFTSSFALPASGQSSDCEEATSKVSGASPLDCTE